MSEDEFEITSPRFFYHKQVGFFEGEQMKRREAWEMTRWLALHVIAPHSKNQLKPKDLAVFEWELAANADDLDDQTKEKWSDELAREWAKWEQELSDNPPIA